MTGVTLDRITDVAMGFMASNALMTAIELDIFSVVGDRPQTYDLIARSVGVDEDDQAFVDLLDGLVALEFLERDGDAEDAHYSNSPKCAEYLNKVSDRYFGSGLLARHRMAAGEASLYADQLRSSDYHEKAAERYGQFFLNIKNDPSKLAAWYQSEAAYESEDHRRLAELFDFSAYTTLLDVPSGMARLPVELGKRHPHLQFIAFDRAKVCALARSYIESKQMHFRVSVEAGDPLTDEYPKADVAVLSHVLRKLADEDKEQSLQRAYEAVPDDGAVLVVDVMYDDLRRSKWYPLLLSVQYKLEAGRGGCMSPASLEQMARKVGFSRFEFHEISRNVVAAFMFK